MCWRGGLRSQIATQWIREAGYTAEQLPGGYKWVRQSFLEILRHPPSLVVLSGLTGSGKTELLQEFKAYALDIEAAARHRGSVFGGTGLAQPSQTVFENTLALSLLKPKVLVEDESRLLGRLCLPENIYQAMLQAPLIHLEVSLEERLHRIYKEYILAPLDQGMSYGQLEKNFLASLDQLKRRLDRHYSAIRVKLIRAFAEDPDPALHGVWIEDLLRCYYDRRYQYALRRSQRMPVFSGDRNACRAWLKNYLGEVC